MLKLNKLIKIFILIVFFKNHTKVPLSSYQEEDWKKKYKPSYQEEDLEKKYKPQNKKQCKLIDDVKQLKTELAELRQSGSRSSSAKVARYLNITLSILAIVSLSYLMYHFWPTKD